MKRSFQLIINELCLGVPAATQTRSLILSNPGSVYDGQAVINSDGSRTNRSGQSSVPILKLPSSVASTRRDFSDNERKSQPAQFTIATFSPDKSGESRLSGQAPVQSPTNAQGEKSRTTPIGLQKVRIIIHTFTFLFGFAQ